MRHPELERPTSLRRPDRKQKAQALPDACRGQPCQARIVEALISNNDDAALARPQNQHCLLEARIEAGQEHDIGEMLAIGVDDKPARSRSLVGGSAAAIIGGGRNLRQLDRQRARPARRLEAEEEAPGERQDDVVDQRRAGDEEQRRGAEIRQERRSLWSAFLATT